MKLKWKINRDIESFRNVTVLQSTYLNRKQLYLSTAARDEKTLSRCTLHVVPLPPCISTRAVLHGRRSILMCSIGSQNDRDTFSIENHRQSQYLKQMTLLICSVSTELVETRRRFLSMIVWPVSSFHTSGSCSCD